MIRGAVSIMAGAYLTLGLAARLGFAAAPDQAPLASSPRGTAAQSVDSTSTDPQPGGAIEQPAGPLDILVRFAKAVDMNDVRTARDLSTGNPNNAEWLTARCVAAGAANDMHKAAVARFGKAADALKEPALVDVVLYGREKLTPGSDTATVILEAPRKDPAVDPNSKVREPNKPVIVLTKLKGQWKVDLSTLPGASDPDAVARANARAHAAGSTASELTGGQYDSVREAGAAMEKKVEAAFEAEARLARLNARARERGGDASEVPINRANPARTRASDPTKGWIGKEKSAAVHATTTGELLAGKTRTLERDAQVTDLVTKEVHDARWSADGQFLLVLQEDGVLRKVAVPDLVEERRIDLAAKAGDLAVSRSAICVALPADNELCVLDPATFEVKKRIPVPGLRRMTASTGSALAFASVADDQIAAINTVNGETKYVTGASLTEQAIRSLGKTARKPASDFRVGFHLITESPDGSVVYCADHLRIHRLRVRSGTLVYEDSSPEIGSDAREVVVSGDGQYIAIPIGAGNLELPEAPRPPFATYVFSGSDLHKPVLTIDGGPHAQAIGFDARTHVVYTQNDAHQLILFSSKGAKLEAINIAEKTDASTTLIRVAPAGGRLLAVVGSQAMLVSFPSTPELSHPPDEP